MDTSLFEPIANLIEKSQNILVLSHAKPDADALGASLSFYLAMKELGKQVTVVTDEPIKEVMAFLPAMNNLQYTLGNTKDFIITLDTSKKSISKIKYNAEEGRVNIIITPKDGVFAASDVMMSAGKNHYDLIVAFDTGNIEYFGPIYDKNVQMFFETPIINIDHHASNTDYGQLNLVLPTAASTTEILYEYLVFLEKRHSKKLISPDVATLLLAGLITDTGSFQNANTSPRSLEVAATLLDLGGRQQEIIKNFYKTKKLSTLKLWGMILSKVQVDAAHRMVWSAISHQDLLESEAEPEETEGIIDDLLTNAPGAEVIFLIKQSKPDMVTISTRSTNNSVDVGKFCAENGGGGHVRAAGFKVLGTRPFDEVAAEIVKKVREFQAKRLNIHEPDSRLPIADSRLPIPDSRFPIPDSRLPIPDSRLPIADFRKTESKTESTVQQPTSNGNVINSSPQPGVNNDRPASNAKPESAIGNRPSEKSEKKVTYLDFPVKQEMKLDPPRRTKPEISVPVAQAKPAEAPVAPAQTPALQPKPAEPVASTLTTTPIVEPKPAAAPTVAPKVQPRPMEPLPQALAPKMTEKADPKPDGSMTADAAKPKKHRKRHNKLKTTGNTATGKPNLLSNNPRT